MIINGLAEALLTIPESGAITERVYHKEMEAPIGDILSITKGAVRKEVADG